MTHGRWMCDPHFPAIVRNALHASASLAFMEVPLASSVCADRVASLTWAVLSNRAWSWAARHHGPPQCYAGLLSQLPLHQRRAMEQIERDWKLLLALEQRRLQHEPACRLWKDIQYARLRPLRLLWSLCEAFKHRINGHKVISENKGTDATNVHKLSVNVHMVVISNRTVS